MLSVMLQMALLIGAGVLWQWQAPSHIPALSHRRALTDLVLYILLPAMVLDVIWRAPFDTSSLKIALTAIARLGLGFSLMWLCLRWLRLTRPQQGALLLAATFPNCTYLGLPVVTELMGAWTQSVVLKFDLFACTPTVLTLGVVLAQRFGSGTYKVSLREILRELTRVPPLWALVIASSLNLAHIPQPEMLHHALAALAGGVVPLMLIALGMSLRWDAFRVQLIPKLFPVWMIVLAIAPFAAKLAGQALGLPAEILTVTTLLAAMPTMIFGIILCERYHLDVALYAAAVFTTTVLSVVTLSLWFCWGS